MLRLVHISDLHLAARPLAVDPLSLAKSRLLGAPLPAGWNAKWVSSFHPGPLLSAARYIARTQPDVVAISGDLSTTGCADDLSCASAFVQGQPTGPAYLTTFPDVRSAFPTIGRRASTWIPGNHDRYLGTGLDPFLPGSTRFEAMFGWPVGQEVVAQRFVSADSTSLLVVGIDVSLKTDTDATPPIGYLAQGRVKQHHVDEAVAFSTHHRTERDVLVWMVHWPPEFPRLSAWHELHDEAALLRAAEAAKVDFMLSGHTHVPHIYVPVSCDVPVVCCGTTSQTTSGGQPHTLMDIRIWKLQGPAGLTAEIGVFAWDINSLEFTRVGGARITPGRLTSLP